MVKFCYKRVAFEKLSQSGQEAPTRNRLLRGVTESVSASQHHCSVRREISPLLCSSRKLNDGWYSRKYSWCSLKIKRYTASLPPSTGKLTPVTKLASSLAKYTAACAIASTLPILCKGTVLENRARSSGVSGTPENLSSRAVGERSGQIEFTRILYGPHSAANPCVIYFWRSISEKLHSMIIDSELTVFTKPLVPP